VKGNDEGEKNLKKFYRKLEGERRKGKAREGGNREEERKGLMKATGSEGQEVERKEGKYGG
jgi:hypothetical protein